MRSLPILPNEPFAPFPDAHTALSDPNGLLAIGGDLSVVRLLNAYAHGIFPWYSEDAPILWWCPDPRTVFRTDRIRLSSRFRRSLRRCRWRVRADHVFAKVVQACATIPRHNQDGTWINQDMKRAYLDLHHQGFAHSVEVFDEDETLVGGIYGVAIGRMFFGESMFSGRSGGSKIALAALAHQLRAWQCPLIDAQVDNQHLRTLGAESMSREQFLIQVSELTSQPGLPANWRTAFGTQPVEKFAASFSDTGCG